MEQNKIFAALLREYKNKKIEKERAVDEAFLSLLNNHPDFAALEAAFRSAEIAAAKAAVSGGNKKEQAALNAAREAKNAWLTANNINTEIFSPAYDCKMCNDSAIYQDKYCLCFLNKLSDKLAASDAPEQSNTFKSAGLNKIKNKEQRERLTKIYAVAKEYSEKFPHVAKKNIALIGKTGTGKTYLLSAIVNELENKDLFVFYLSAFALNNLLLKYHTTFDEDKMIYFDALLNCDVLAIDDLGSEPVYKNVTKEYLYSIINERNKTNKCTVYSTNLSPSDLRDRYEDRVAFRLLDKDKTLVIEFTGDDLRINKGE